MAPAPPPYARPALANDPLQSQLNDQRHDDTAIEADIAQSVEQQVALQQRIEQQKTALDTLRFEWQESKVWQQTVTEQLTECAADVEQLLKQLPEQANEAEWKAKASQLTHQLEKLGSINLTAIEEHSVQAERLRELN